MRVKYDTIRVWGEGVQNLIHTGNHEMLTRSGLNGINLQYGKWKRKQGLIDGEVEWDEPLVFAEFLRVAGLSEYTDLAITRFDTCRDLALGDFKPSEFIMCANAGFSALGGRWTSLTQKDTYLTLQKNRTAFTIYWKQSRSPEVSDRKIRFEYRLMDSAAIKRDFGRQLRLSDLCDPQIFDSADSNYSQKWDEITDDVRLWTASKIFEDPSDDMQASVVPGDTGALKSSGVAWSQVVNALEIKLFMDFFAEEIGKQGFLAVMVFIGIHCCRRAFGRQWWKLFPTPDEASKKQLQRLRARSKQIHEFYEWGVENKKFDRDFKSVMKDMLGTTEGANCDRKCVA